MFATLRHNLSDVTGCISSEADLHYLTTCCSTCSSSLGLTLSMSCICLPFLSLCLRKSKLVQRRRYTCPSAQDISRALQNPSSAPSASAVSLDELIQRCLNCFGQSLCCTCSQSLSCAFRSLSQPGYINEMREGKEGIRGETNQQRGGSEGDKGQSHTIKLCFVGPQRPASYFHAALNYPNPCPHWLSITFMKSINYIFL